MSLTPFVLLLMLLHGWVGWRLAPSLALWSPLAASVLWIVLAASLVLMPLAFTGRRRQARGALATSATWAGLIGMGLFSTLFVLTLVRDTVLVAALLVAVAAGLAGAGWISLEPWMGASAVAVPVLALLATAWGFWNARRTATVVRVDVPIAGLPEALHGFSVAQISDIHVGPTIGQRYVQRIVDRVNALGADMVAITGDLVDGQVDDLRGHVAPLARLVSTHGSFFVTGNHEYYSGAHAWIAELRGLGVQVLLNEHRVLHHEGAAETLPDGVALHRDTEMVVVAGVADFSAHHFDASHRSDPHAAIHGAPAGVRLRLLLAHQPRSALAASGAGFDLQLSGHTHGGQFWPWMYFVRYQQPFTAGLRRLGDLWVYTNRGTGYWGPPKRFGVASEITHLRLVPA
ncbi:MAG: metallophosphoesterase [Rhodoferax sp.]|nr:metallophosphoesterase [Rhodoferax sp.]